MVRYKIYKTKKEAFSRKEEEIPIAEVEDINTYVDTDVENFVKYRYKIKSESEDEVSDFSDEKVVVPAPKPDTPTGLQGSAVKKVITLSWDDVIYPVGKKIYNIYRNDEKIDETFGNSYKDVVSENGTYKYQVSVKIAFEI